MPRAAFGKLLLNEGRLAWRQPVGLLFGLGLPLLLLIVFGSLPSFKKHEHALGGLTYFNAYVPILLALVIAALGLWGLPGPLAGYRAQGILRRLSTTPVPPAWVLAAQIGINLLLAAMALVILVVVGIAAFGVNVPKSGVGFMLAVVLSIAAIFAIGLCVAAIARGAGAANAMGSAAFFPLMFFAGLWVPSQPGRAAQHQRRDSARRIRASNPERNPGHVSDRRIVACTSCIRHPLRPASNALLQMGVAAIEASACRRCVLDATANARWKKQTRPDTRRAPACVRMRRPFEPSGGCPL
jgi:ABC-2 type transport system permease protein